MTRKAKVTTTILALITVMAVLLATYRVRWVTHGQRNSELWWSQEEAYLLITTSRQGVEHNLLQFAGDLISAQFGIASTDVRPDLEILRFGGSTVERNALRNVRVGQFKVLDGHIYTTVNGSAMRLAGMQFEKAADDQRRFDAATVSDRSDGWSRESGILNRQFGETKFTLQIRNQEWTVIAYSNRESREVRLDLQAPDGSRKRIWHLDQQPRYVNKRQYNSFLNE